MTKEELRKKIKELIPKPIDRRILFRKLILAIMFMHLERAKESDPNYSEALDLLVKDIDYHLQIFKFSPIEYKVIELMAEVDDFLDRDKEINYILFSLYLFEKLLKAKKIFKNIIVFKRKTIARVKLYSNKLSIWIEQGEREGDLEGKEVDIISAKLAKKIWEDYKYICDVRSDYLN